MMRTVPAIVRAGVGLTVALLLGLSAAPEAAAAPLGTTPVTPSAEQCGAGETIEKTVACGAALRDEFLRARGRADVVRETVFTPPGWGWVWKSQAGPTICGYADFPAVPGVPDVAVGTHHCDAATFVVANRDGRLFRTDVRATTVLIHESAHGVQEKAGNDVVLATLVGDVGRQKPMEQSADCWAGMGVRYLVDKGSLPPSAHREAAELMYSVGDRGAGTLHGTKAERRDAFDVGYRRGAPACDALAGQRIFATR